MDKLYHVKEFGENIRRLRKDLNMSQEMFYKDLYPDPQTHLFGIVKKMNLIEKGKQKNVDMDFLLRVSSKYDLSCDYLLGLTKDYSNHELEFVCKYTGLKEKAVKTLHEWNLNQNNGADPNRLDDVFVGHDVDFQYAQVKKAAEGKMFLRILNYLFMETEIKGKKHSKKYTNTRVLYALYQLCVGHPKRVMGYRISTDANVYTGMESGSVNGKEWVDLDTKDTLMMEDDNTVWHFYSAEMIMENIARKQLDESLNEMIENIRNEVLSQPTTT